MGRDELPAFHLAAPVLGSASCPAVQGQAQDVKEVNHIHLALFLSLGYCSDQSRLSQTLSEEADCFQHPGTVLRSEEPLTLWPKSATRAEVPGLLSLQLQESHQVLPWPIGGGFRTKPQTTLFWESTEIILQK